MLCIQILFQQTLRMFAEIGALFNKSKTTYQTRANHSAYISKSGLNKALVKADTKSNPLGLRLACSCTDKLPHALISG